MRVAIYFFEKNMSRMGYFMNKPTKNEWIT